MRAAFTSVRGAPGTTTLALATALELGHRGHTVILIEADPAGGVLTAELGLPISPGLLEFCANPLVHDITTLTDSYVHWVNDTVRLLAGPSSARQATAALDTGATRLNHLLRATEDHVVIDLGRTFPHSTCGELASVADRIVYVVRPVVSELAALISAFDHDDTEASGRMLALVDSPPHAATRAVHPREATEVLATYGTVVTVPWDAPSVRRLTEERSKKWARTGFAMAVGRIADELATSMTPPESEMAPDLPLAELVSAEAVS